MALIDTLRASGALVLYHDYRSGNLYDYSGQGNSASANTGTWTSREGLYFTAVQRATVPTAAELVLTQGSVVCLVDFRHTITGINFRLFGNANWFVAFNPTTVYFRSNGVDRTVACVLVGSKCLGVNFNSGEGVAVYTDGNYVNISTSLSVVPAALDLYIGNDNTGSLGCRNYFRAICIINRKLTATEHAQIYGELQAMKWPTKTITRAKPIKNIGLPEANLLSAFKLQRSGATVYDNGTLLNNATVSGCPVFHSGRRGASAEFNISSSDRVVNSTSNSYLFESPLTVSCWYKPVSVATNASIIGRESTNNRLMCDVDALADFRMNADNLTLNCGATDLLRADVWVHLAATYDGANVNLYYNGVLSSTTPYSTAYVETNTAINIGNIAAGTTPVPGSVADCKYYQRCLSSAEILQEYQRGARGGYSIGRFKQRTIGGGAGQVLGQYWVTQTSTGVTGVETVGSNVVTYAKANTAAIFRLAASPSNNRVDAAGASSAGQVTSAQNCFGTWLWYINKASDTSTVRLVPILNSASEWDAGGAINGYLLEIDANEAIGLYRITTSAKASTVMLSANSYITRNTWHKIKLTRAVNGTFTLYVDDVLVPASSGANPGSDTTYLTGYDISQVSLTDGDKFALSCDTGACSYLRTEGVI